MKIFTYLNIYNWGFNSVMRIRMSIFRYLTSYVRNTLWNSRGIKIIVFCTNFYKCKIRIWWEILRENHNLECKATVHRDYQSCKGRSVTMYTVVIKFLVSLKKDIVLKSIYIHIDFLLKIHTESWWRPTLWAGRKFYIFVNIKIVFIKFSLKSYFSKTKKIISFLLFADVELEAKQHLLVQQEVFHLESKENKILGSEGTNRVFQEHKEDIYIYFYSGLPGGEDR